MSPTFSTIRRVYAADSFNDTLRRLDLAGANWFSSSIGGQVQVTGCADSIGSPVHESVRLCPREILQFADDSILP